MTPALHISPGNERHHCDGLQSKQEATTPNNLYNSDNAHKVKTRQALALWAINYHTGQPGAKKKLQITRTNGTTKKKEWYITERADHYQKTRMVRLLDIWCRLRALAGRSGMIKEHKAQMKEILAACECSINKLKPAIAELHTMGWLTVTDDHIRITAERVVYQLCQLDYERRIDHVFYKPEKIHNEKQTHYWIYLADVADNRKRQAYVVYKKIMNAPEEMKQSIYTELKQRGCDLRNNTADPMQICSILNAVYRDSFHSKAAVIHDWLVDNRPDVNRGVMGMADAWSTAPTNVSYIKKKIREQLLAFITKVGTISSDDRLRNGNVHLAVRDGITVAKGVGWNKEDKCTFQAFCDDIEPRQPYNFQDMQYKIPSVAA